MFYVLMLRENVKEPYHTLQHPEVEYTPAVREEIRLEKIMDARDMQLRMRWLTYESQIAVMDYQEGNVGTRRGDPSQATRVV